LSRRGDAADFGMSDPIFVVGVPRSGTTLLAAMLGGHSRLACGPETHFFSASTPEGLQAAVADPDWPRKAVALLCSLTLFGGRKAVDDYGFSRAELEHYLAAREPSVRAMLEALTAQHAARLGKPRWVEKTPPHLQCLDEIRRHFPGAPIIRIIRDPRDVVASLCGMPWTSTSALANAYLVAERDDASWRFFASDSNAVSIRYEHLVADPVAALAPVCTLIGEPFEEAMLDTAGTASAVVRSGEWYKARVASPLDAGRVGRWQKDFSAGEVRGVEMICHATLARYGYPGAGRRPRRAVCVYPLTREVVEAQEAALLRLFDDGTLLVPGPDPLAPGGCGQGDCCLLLDGLDFGPAPARRLWRLMRFGWRCLRRRAGAAAGVVALRGWTGVGLAFGLGAQPAVAHPTEEPRRWVRARGVRTANLAGTRLAPRTPVGACWLGVRGAAAGVVFGCAGVGD